MHLRHLGLAVVLALAACGGDSAPVERHIAYTPPATPGGRICSNQCVESRAFCQQGCDLDNRACYYEMQKAAARDYDAYARQQFQAHAPVTMLPSDFEHPAQCNGVKESCLAACDKPYNQCYKTCGGAITVTSSCQFMCFD